MDKLNKILSDKNCFIFDFDGVIKDSVNIKTEAFEEIYQPYGNEIVRKVRDYHIENGGLSRFEKFKYYEEILLNKKISKNKINNLSKKFSHIVKSRVISSPPLPGIIDFLELLHSKNISLFINSATPLEELQEIIIKCNYDKYFVKVFGSPNSKTQNLLSILSEFDFQSKNAVFFGDARNDLIASYETDISFIGVGNLFEKSEIQRVKNYYLINDFTDIKLNNFIKR